MSPTLTTLAQKGLSQNRRADRICRHGRAGDGDGSRSVHRHRTDHDGRVLGQADVSTWVTSSRRIVPAGVPVGARPATVAVAAGSHECDGIPFADAQRRQRFGGASARPRGVGRRQRC